MFLAVDSRQPLHTRISLDSRQPLLTRISLDSRDSRQNCDENHLRFAMYNAEFRTLSYILFYKKPVYKGPKFNKRFKKLTLRTCTKLINGLCTWRTILEYAMAMHLRLRNRNCIYGGKVPQLQGIIKQCCGHASTKILCHIGSRWSIFYF